MPKNPYRFIAGGYIRVSVNDNSSVNTQKMIIQNYVDENPDIRLRKFYIDDGVSSFVNNKPAFQEMLTDIENKIINCVIVKDISRFGRDDLETAEYIQRNFPIYGTRFVAITDNHDSHSDEKNLDFSFMLKNLVNYAYSKDISKKVRTVICIKQEQGEYVAAMLPYGYRKQIVDRTTKYVVDEDAAATIRNIFLWASQGDTGYVIASRLNESNVPSPGEYRKQNTYKTERKRLWTRNAVMEILRNLAYIGILVMGKTWTPSMQMRTPKRIAKTDCIMAFAHHDPIIDQEIFHSVQRLLDSRTKPVAPKKHGQRKNAYLGSKLYCGDCGRKMKHRSIKDKTYYICPRYMEAKDACTAKRISDTDLLDDVYDSIMLEIERVKVYREQQFGYEQSLAFKMKNDRLKNRLHELYRELEFYDSSLQKRYEALANKMINKSDYALVSEYIDMKRNTCKAELYEIQSEIDHYQRNVSSNCAWIKGFLNFADAYELTEEMYNKLIDRLLVRDTGIDVIFT